MRVLQINKFFYPKGGTERYFFLLSRALQERGHDVVHFSMRHPDNLDSPYADYFIDNRDYSRSGVGSVPSALSMIRSKEAARNIRRLIRDHRPDIAHLHNIYHQITPSIIPELTAAAIPIVMTLHDYKLVCPNYSMFDGKQLCHRCAQGRFYHAPMVRCHEGSIVKSALLAFESYYQKRTHVYDGVDFFLTPSHFMRERVVEDGYARERVVYMPNPIEPHAYTEPPGRVHTTATESTAGNQARDVAPALDSDATPETHHKVAGEARHEGALDLPERFALYFGRIAREKGLATLLEALGRVSGIPLVVAGDGPERAEMERVARDKGIAVTFTGHLPPAAMEQLLHRAYVVVLPSESPENAPYTALEAMAAGVPLIAASIGGLPELTEKGGGRLFPPGDAAALASELAQLWEAPDHAREIGKQSRMAVDEYFLLNAHIERLEDIYKRATDGVHRATATEGS